MTEIQPGPTSAPNGARADYVPASDYISRDFAALEARHLWPRVWQMACREEEMPNVGDFTLTTFSTSRSLSFARRRSVP